MVCLLLALALRLWLAPARGHVHDLDQFKAWTEAALAHGPLQVYSGSTANYPPLAMLPLMAMGAFYQALPIPDDADASLFTALLKLPTITADLLTTLIIFHLVRRRHDERAALLSATAYAFQPAIWYTSAWWGQLEALYTLPMLLALATLDRGRPGWAGGLLAAAMLVKPQAAVIGPVVALGSWRRHGWRGVARGALAAGLVALAVLAPLAWSGELPSLWAQLRASAGRQLFLTMNAHNLWYLLTFGRGSFAARHLPQPILDTEPILGPLNGWHIGLVLLAAWSLFVLWSWWRSREDNSGSLYLPAAALVIGFFMLPAESHERYLFPALAMLAPLLPERPAVRWLFAALGLTLMLNLLWVDPAVPLPGFAEQLMWGIPMALINTAALSFTALLILRLPGRPGAQ